MLYYYYYKENAAAQNDEAQKFFLHFSCSKSIFKYLHIIFLIKKVIFYTIVLHAILSKYLFRERLHEISFYLFNDE